MLVFPLFKPLSCSSQNYKLCKRGVFINVRHILTHQHVPLRHTSTTFRLLQQPRSQKENKASNANKSHAFLRATFLTNRGMFPRYSLVNSAYTSLASDGNLKESEALTLMSMCLNQSNRNNNEESCKLSEQIYKSTNVKTVDLFNMLLQVYHACDKMYQSGEILHRMKLENVKPNEFTYAQLIAGHCMKGDVGGANEIVQFLKCSKMKIPFEVYGYLAYGMCKAGYPENGFQIIQKFSQANESIPSNLLFWLCRGLIENGSLNLYRESISTFAPQVHQKMSIHSVISIFQHLPQQQQKQENIQMILNLAEISEIEIIKAVEFLQTTTSASSANFIKYLIDYYHAKIGYLPVFKTKLIKIYEALLLPNLKNSSNISNVWNEVLSLKEFFPEQDEVEYATLYFLLRKKSPLSASFANKLAEQNILLDFNKMKKMRFLKNVSKKNLILLEGAWRQILPVPNKPSGQNKAQSSSPNVVHKNALKPTAQQSAILPLDLAMKSKQKYSEDVRMLFQDLNASTVKDTPILLSSLLTKVLSLPWFNSNHSVIGLKDLKSDVLSVFEKHSHECTLESFALYLNKQLNGIELSNFQNFYDELSSKGFKVNADELSKLNDQLYPQNTFLSSIFTINTNSSPSILSSFDEWQHFSENDKELLSVLLKNLGKAQSQFEGNVPDSVISDILIVGHHNLSDNSFWILSKTCMKHLNSQRSLPNFLFSHALEKNNFRQASDLLKKYKNSISFDVQIIPLSVMKKNGAKKSLLQYLTKKMNQQETTTWIEYCSLLKADLPSKAYEVLKADTDLIISPRQMQNMCSNFATHNVLSKKFHEIAAHCQEIPGFNYPYLCMAVVDDHLAKGNVDSAKRFFHENLESRQDIDLFLLQNVFSFHGVLPPAELFRSHHRTLVESTTQDNMSIRKVLYNVKQLYSNYHMYPSHHTTAALCLFFTKLPLGEYDAVCKEMKLVYPAFKPHRQSKILLDRIQRLMSLKRFDEAISFSLKFLVPSSSNNFLTWRRVIETFGNAALLHDQPQLLTELQKSSLLKTNKPKKMVEGYLVFLDLASGNKLPFENSIQLASELLTNVQDKDAFVNLLNITLERGLNYPLILQTAVAVAIGKDIEMKRMNDLLKSQGVSPKDLIALAAHSYSVPSTCEQLLTVDAFLREQAGSDVNLNVILNDRLFRQFCKLSLTSELDDMTFKYLIDHYHKVPSHMNTEMSRFIYLELFSTFKYM